MSIPACSCIGRIWNILIAFYLWFNKVRINVHQQIAHWRSRIDAQNSRISEHSLQTRTNADAESAQKQSLSELNSIHHSFKNHYSSLECDCKSLSRKDIGSPTVTKTPRLYQTRLTTILRRFSLRNFMDYCVAALNEASNSSSSNRFDLNVCNATVWLLGRQYDLPQQGDQLIDDIKSKIWITYRRNFPPIDDNTRYTTDRGFGCMIRCGQMVIANALLCKNLSRDWRWSPAGLEANPQIYSRILRLFQDRADCYYSIHRIVQAGQKHEGKNVGEWFGPNTIAQALKKLSVSQSQDLLLETELIISIDAALDNIVVIDEIKSKFKKPSSANSGDHADHIVDNWTPGILFIQLRLGLTKINPLYFGAIKKTFQFKNSLGIIGGRPNHALYLVGYTDDDIIYLDPHNTQQYIDLDESAEIGKVKRADNLPIRASVLNNEQSQPFSKVEDLGSSNNHPAITLSNAYQLTPDETYHCSCPEKMPVDRLDPSLALCFFFNSELEFDDWCRQSQEVLVKSEQAPMFEVTNSRPNDWNVTLTSTTTKTISTKDKSNKSSSSLSDQDEEFEILT